MPAVAEKPKQIDPKRLDFCNIPELPRQFGMIVSDLGISSRAEYMMLCQRMRTSPEAKAKLNVVREVLFEIMARDLEERLIRTDFGEIPTIEELNSLGQKVKTPVINYELCGKWDISEGADTWIGGEGPGRVRPKAAHWKTYVTEHWEHLAPKLLFRDKDVQPPKNDPLANPETYRATVAYSMSNENDDRKALLSWLSDFLKAGKPSQWDGKRTWLAKELVNES